MDAEEAAGGGARRRKGVGARVRVRVVGAAWRGRESGGAQVCGGGREREDSQEVRSLPSSSTLDRGVVVERGAVRAACKQRRHAVSRPSSMVHVRLSALQCRMYQSAEMKAYVPTDGWGTGGLRLHKATKCSSRLGGRWL